MSKLCLLPGIYVAARNGSACIASPLRLFRRPGSDATFGRSVPVRPENVAETADRTDEARVGRVRLDLLADAVDSHVDRTVECIRVPRVVSVVDCGRVISPRTAESQVRGGVGWGIGAALREVSEVDTRYGGFLNADLAEYVLPVNADIGAIDVEFIDKPDYRFNSAGAKGLGEVSMVGVAAAIANAVHHATGRRFRDLPIRLEHLL